MPYSQSGQTWSPPKRLTWTNGTTEKTSLYIDKGDNLHLVWYDDSLGNADIFYKSSQDEGLNWTAPKRLSWNYGSSDYPKLAVDSNNNLFLTWENQLGDYISNMKDYEIYFKESTDGGSQWSPITRLTWTPNHSLYPDIAVDSKDQIHISWTDHRSGSAEVYYRNRK